MSRLLSSERLLSKGYVGMQCPTSSDLCVVEGDNDMPCQILSVCVCGKRAMMAFHARCHWNLCAVQGLNRHATPEVVRSCVLSKGYDGRPRPMSSGRV